MSDKKKAKQTEWTVECKIKGVGWLTVMATSKEEAEEAAWAAFHGGVEPQGVEWEVDDMEAGQ